MDSHSKEIQEETSIILNAGDKNGVRHQQYPDLRQ